jgi:phenylpropionate dioxygenase-like ring-hydroxylating dioxygenase large terminal subunit
MTTIETGAAGAPGARSSGPSVQELLDADTRAVPLALRDHRDADTGAADLPKSRYTSPVFAELEAEYLWRSTWQLACREEQIPNKGDHVVYDVVDESLIVVRTGDGSIRAFHNACLHRGTRLRPGDGRVASFRCPFHGWTWSLDGQLTDIPCAWDFPQVLAEADGARLPEARVATWAGFVFVNLDPDAVPFETYAATLIEHGAAFEFDKRYVAFHAVKEVPANWKVVMEAFSEAYHVIATHPQILEFCGDANSEYSIWPENPEVSRFINAFGIQSPHLRDVLGDQHVIDAYLKFSSRRAAELRPTTDTAEGSRAVVADVFRQRLAQTTRADLDAATDAEILDAILYHLFPAFAPWAGIGQPLVYRWRPGPTPDTSYMDVMRLQRVPDDGPRPSPAPTTHLTLDQAWREAPGMGTLADVFEQDMENLPRVQQGLKSRGKRTVSFGRYQEGRLRHIHRMIDRAIERGLVADGRSTAELAPFRVGEG